MDEISKVFLSGLLARLVQRCRNLFFTSVMFSLYVTAHIRVGALDIRLKAISSSLALNDVRCRCRRYWFQLKLSIFAVRVSRINVYFGHFGRQSSPTGSGLLDAPFFTRISNQLSQFLLESSPASSPAHELFPNISRRMC